MLRAKTVNRETTNNTERDVLKKQNIQLQQTIDRLSAQVDKTILENEALRCQNQRLQTTLEKANATTEEVFPNGQLSLFNDLPIEPPYLDINGLAFADEETSQQIQMKYAEDLYAYIKNRIEKEGRVS